jgi:general stress protein YciG
LLTSDEEDETVTNMDEKGEDRMGEELKEDENESKDETREGGKSVGGLSEEEMRERVIRLAFGGDPRRFEEFCEVVRAGIPPDTSVVLRGSSVTGVRYDDGAPFDADGPGTSDLDLTLVGVEVLGHYILDGFYIPGIHTKPLSDKDPDIAPELVPLRDRLVAMVKRPVNIQATRDFVMQLRGDLMGQPYLTLLGKVGGE